MRVAVVHFGSTSSARLLDIARGLVSGIESQGHQVELVDGDRDTDQRLTGFGYVVFGCPVASLFGGKIPARVAEWLPQAGMIAGKKCYAFVTRAPFGAQRALLRLMTALEREGMFVRDSSVLRSGDEARVIGSRLSIS